MDNTTGSNISFTWQDTVSDSTSWINIPIGQPQVVRQEPEKPEPKEEKPLEWLDRRVEEMRELSGLRQAA